MKPSREQLIYGLKSALAVLESLRVLETVGESIPGKAARSICYAQLVDLLLEDGEIDDSFSSKDLLMWAANEMNKMNMEENVD